MRALLLVALLAACSSSPGDPVDAGPDADGEVAVDANERDGAALDADGPDASDEDASDGDIPDADASDGETPTGCVGDAPSCFGRGAEACAIGLGCTSRDICIGTAAPCIFQPDAASCGAVEGCSWNGTQGRCGGAQRTCNTYQQDTTACWNQPGCAASIACMGAITACPEIEDAVTCLSQAGCAWVPPPAGD